MPSFLRRCGPEAYCHHCGIQMSAPSSPSVPFLPRLDPWDEMTQACNWRLRGLERTPGGFALFPLADISVRFALLTQNPGTRRVSGRHMQANAKCLHTPRHRTFSKSKPPNVRLLFSLQRPPRSPKGAGHKQCRLKGWLGVVSLSCSQVLPPPKQPSAAARTAE